MALRLTFMFASITIILRAHEVMPLGKNVWNVATSFE